MVWCRIPFRSRNRALKIGGPRDAIFQPHMVKEQLNSSPRPELAARRNLTHMLSQSRWKTEPPTETRKESVEIN